MQSKLRAKGLIATLLLFFGCPCALPAAPEASSIKIRCSLAVRGTHDDNIFAAGASTSVLPSTDTPVARRDRASWITTLSFRADADLGPVLPRDGALNKLILTLQSEASSFASAHSEDFAQHAFSFSGAARLGDGSLNAENSVTWIDGARQSILYPEAKLSAYGAAMVRERRQQVQTRGQMQWQVPAGAATLRLTGAWTLFDLGTEQRALTGFQNFPDRSDISFGADASRRIGPATWTLGLHWGRQTQDLIVGSPLSSSSTYQRALLGVHFKRSDRYDLRLLVGPDFRHYAANAPVANRDMIRLYAESAFTLTLGHHDSVAFKSRNFQWVSSTGKVPYFDSTYALTHTHVVSPRCTIELSTKALGSNYHSGRTSLGGPANLRDDWLYTGSAGIRFAVSPRLTLLGSLSLDAARNRQAGLASPQDREWDRQRVSFGANASF